MSGESNPCPEPLPYCKYPEPFTDNHHTYWPAPEYTTPLEKKFRGLEGNIIRGICRCLHDLEHLKKPPAKPSIKAMRLALEQSVEAEL